MTPEEIQRRTDGTFLKGTSGNPSGRPKAASTLMRERLATEAEDIVRVVLDAAKGGDMQAAKLVLDRLVPPLKPVSLPVHLGMPADGKPLAMAITILEAATSGEIPPDIAAQLISATAQLCRIEEVEELRDRITALEQATAPRT